MAKRLRRTKATIPDSDILTLNSLGLSLSTIADQLGCHPTTITLRLKDLGVAPADTRRAFMEDIVMSLPEDQIEWLASQLGPHDTIKAFVKSLITTAYLETRK